MSAADAAFAKALDLDDRAAQARDQATALVYATRALVHAQLADLEQQRERWDELDTRPADEVIEVDRPMSHPGRFGDPIRHDDLVPPHTPTAGDDLVESARCADRTLVVDKDGDAWRRFPAGWRVEYEASAPAFDTAELLAKFGPCRVVWVP